jgi:hypothetical protein
MASRNALLHIPWFIQLDLEAGKAVGGRMKLATLALLGCAVASVLSQPANARDYNRRGDYYQSSDGTMVHVPEKDGEHGKESAVCGDGTHSYSHHHQGACSHHGGVARWE